MVVGYYRAKSEASSNQEIAHDGLEPGLTTLEVVACKQSTFHLSVLDNAGVESILRGSIEIKYLLFNGGDTVKY